MKFVYFPTGYSICVYGILKPKERRSVAEQLRAAAKHPLVTAYLWMSAALELPIFFLYPVGYVLTPISIALGLVTLPLGCLLQIIVPRYKM